MRLNLGCGDYPIRGWDNWDADPEVPADRHHHVPPIPLPDGSVEEVYMGHLLEHVEPEEATALLAECRRVLQPGGILGVVVPNTRKILAHYLAEDHTEVEVPYRVYWNLDDLDSVCAVFLYSTIQPSRHKWAYDSRTLFATLERAGFRVDSMIRPDDPRLSVPSWWDLGYSCHKPVLRAEPVPQPAEVAAP